jgi:hypothetical protein
MSTTTAALDYARRWPVLPLKGKLPLTTHGLRDATSDAEAARDWWQRWPTANIGLRTGMAFDALDCDSLEAVHAVETPGGHDVRRPDGAHRARLARPLPSDRARESRRHPPGRRLARQGRVRRRPALRSRLRRAVPLVARRAGHAREPPPAVILRLLDPPAKTLISEWASVRPVGTGGNISGLLAKAATAPEGQRNAILHWSACRLGEDAAVGKMPDLVDACEQLLLRVLGPSSAFQLT